MSSENQRPSEDNYFRNARTEMLKYVPFDAARNTFYQVLVGDFYEQAPTLDAGTFDCVIGNDVVEHLTDPWCALALLRQLLEPGRTPSAVAAEHPFLGRHERSGLARRLELRG